MKYKILTIHNRYLIRGGEDESVDSQIRLLNEKGHKNDLLEYSNREIDKIGRVKTALRTIWSFKAYHEVKKILASGEYDILDCQNTFPLFSPSVYYAASKLKIPVIQTLRNYRPLCPSALFYRDGKVCEDCLGKSVQFPAIRHKCYRESILGSATLASMNYFHKKVKSWENKVDLFVTLTEFARNKYIQAGFPEDRIVVKPNFVYPDPGVGQGLGDYALFVGRLTKEKGIKTLIKAWKKIGSTLPLKIIGEGPLVNLVKEDSKTYQGIEYLGKRDVNEVYDFMGEAKVLIFPSEWYETFGRVAVEAFAKGTPVIASNIGAISEIVRDGVTGLYFKPGDSEDLVEKVKIFLSDPHRINKMREFARKEYEEKYTADRNYEMLMEIYEKAISLANVRHKN
ncbi:glycosyltransferase family 4 protein [Aeribacillus sp. FSL M8-0235]|uniref:glycosyltransferase family 4 protein n=1 Tax=Aeribacillus sp. FSL M8-0235 TaxID=2954576 RepID=UPI0030F54B83